MAKLVPPKLGPVNHDLITAEHAIHKVYAEGKHPRRDVGGKATTEEYTLADAL